MADMRIRLKRSRLNIPPRYIPLCQWVSVVLALTILILNFVLPDPVLEPMEWAAVGMVVLALAVFVMSFRSENRAMTRKLLEHIIPQRFAELPVARTDFTRAIHQLVEVNYQRHKGGLLPLIEDLRSEIGVEVLPPETYDSYGIPQLPENCTWKWLRLRMKSSWRLTPSQLAGSGTREWTPDEFLGEVVVMSYPTYAELLPFINPGMEVYYPISSPVYAAVADKEALATIRFLTSKGGADRRLLYQVHMVNGEVKQGDTYDLWLSPRLQSPKSAKKRKTEILALFPGLRDMLPTTQDRVCKGVFEVYRYDGRQDLKSLRIQAGDKCAWHFETEVDYVLPARLVRGDDVVWEQRMLLFPFTRITTVAQFQFKTNDPKRILLGQDRPPAVLTMPALMGPAPVIELDGSTWTVRPGKGFHFPGDVILFWWKDSPEP